MLSKHIPKKIGLTGGIGSGKSVACHYFESLGIPVCDADHIAHQITQAHQPVIGEIIKLFGQDIVDINGELKRKQIRQRVFNQPHLLKQLEALLHPIIRQSMYSWINQQSHHYIILSIPLLFEKGWQTEVDRILVIDTTPELQMQRALARDNSSEQTIHEIINLQIDREARLALADDIAENSGTIDSLHQQLLKFHQLYLSQS
jgi:dephospho-CoA kinase